MHIFMGNSHFSFCKMHIFGQNAHFDVTMHVMETLANAATDAPCPARPEGRANQCVGQSADPIINCTL